MVFLGQWPFEHTISIDKLFRDTGLKTAYYVDKDKIINEEEINSLVKKGFKYNDKFHVISSEELYQSIAKMIPQFVPPDIPEDKDKLMKSNVNPLYQKIIDKIKKASAVLLVENIDSSIMTDIGAIWNSNFGTWILDINHLKVLREKNKKMFGDKIEVKPQLGSNLLIRGDVSHFIDKLNEINAIYQDDGTWIISNKDYHKISPYINKKK